MSRLKTVLYFSKQRRRLTAVSITIIDQAAGMQAEGCWPMSAGQGDENKVIVILETITKKER